MTSFFPPTSLSWIKTPCPSEHFPVLVTFIHEVESPKFIKWVKEIVAERLANRPSKSFAPSERTSRTGDITLTPM